MHQIAPVVSFFWIVPVKSVILREPTFKREFVRRKLDLASAGHKITFSRSSELPVPAKTAFRYELLGKGFRIFAKFLRKVKLFNRLNYCLKKIKNIF